MRTARSMIGALGAMSTALLLAAGCSSSSASRADAPAPTASPPSAGQRLFADTFDDDHNLWTLPESENGRTEMVGGDLVWEAKRAADLRPHLLAAPIADAFDRGELRMRDVVVRATFTTVRGSGAMGVFCREVRDTDSDFQWFEFVARDGYAAIRRADAAGHLEVLATTTKVDLPLGQRATMEAVCTDTADGSARLWLSLDGAAILEATSDEQLGNGAAGLQGYDSPDRASSARFLVRWHDFAVYRPTT
jgi:hypothetical protein